MDQYVCVWHFRLKGFAFQINIRIIIERKTFAGTNGLIGYTNALIADTKRL
jgi:hypothetical protein